MKEHKGQIAAVVVMSPSHKLIPVIRIFCRHLLILDAGWPLIDGNLSRRDSNFRWAPKTIYVYLKLSLIDWLSIQLADLVLLETNEQRKRLNSHFLFKRANFRVTFTGFNESGQVVNSNENARKVSINREFQSLRTRILFRGKINLESGFQNLVQAFKLLSDDFEILYAVDRVPPNHVLLPNEKFITKFNDPDLTLLYEQSDICIGQVSSHERLRVTIPHKAFEAAYFSKPYISADSAAIRELASEDDIFLLNETTPQAISQAIIKIASNPDLMLQLGRNFHKKYEKLASQRVLVAQLENLVIEFSPTSLSQT